MYVIGQKPETFHFASESQHFSWLPQCRSVAYFVFNFPWKLLYLSQLGFSCRV